MRKLVSEITRVPMVKSSIKHNWNQQVLQRRDIWTQVQEGTDLLRPSLMLYFDDSDSTPHPISTQKKASLFTDSRKENALPSIQKKSLLHDRKF